MPSYFMIGILHSFHIYDPLLVQPSLVNRLMEHGLSLGLASNQAFYDRYHLLCCNAN